MFRFLEQETPQKEKKRGFATQIVVGMMASLFAGSLLALMGWNAQTNVDIKQGLQGVNSKLTSTVEDVDDNTEELDAVDQRIRRQRDRVLQNQSLINQNERRIDENRDYIMELENLTERHSRKLGTKESVDPGEQGPSAKSGSDSTAN